MRSVAACILLLCWGSSLAQPAYPEPESAAAWRSLAASYVRKAVRDGTLDRNPVLNARVDAVMAVVGASVARLDPRFAAARWKALLVEDFGHGAAAFPGEIILIDARFLRELALDDHELALVLCHEAAHVVAGHASAKLSFMAATLGKERLPTANRALLEFLATDAYAAVFQPVARRQEREADALGAEIFAGTSYEPGRALRLFDKLAALENEGADGETPDVHDAARVRGRLVSGVWEELRRRNPPRVTAVP